MKSLLLALVLSGGPPEWREALERWRAGQDVEPIAVTVDPTWYDPALGGINCNGDCEHVGPSAYGMRVEDWYERGAACPSELPRFSTLTFTPRDRAEISVVCVDGGEAITALEDGTIRVDVLTTTPLWTERYPATLTLPPAPYRPTLSCPVENCNREEVFIQGVNWSDHWGVDLWTPGGRVVRAPAAGQVTFAGERNGLGGEVVIELGGEWWVRIGHLSIIGVEEGRVRQGQYLGFVGDSGLTWDGEHAHIELWRGDTPHDVLEFIEPPRIPAAHFGHEEH